jgi:hypothetical protein
MFLIKILLEKDDTWKQKKEVCKGVEWNVFFDVDQAIFLSHFCNLPLQVRLRMVPNTRRPTDVKARICEYPAIKGKPFK